MKLISPTPWVIMLDRVLKEQLESIDNNESIEKISDWYFD